MVVQRRGGAYFVAIEGLRELDLSVADASSRITRAASAAINRTAARMRTRGARMMNEQIAFGMGYLTRAQSGSPARLAVTKQASPGELTAVIRGRDRPTSLARFVRGARTRRRGRSGVTVTVSPGASKRMDDAFLLDLKSGNTGLALRLKPGEQVRNKRMMVAAFATRTQNRRRPSDRNLYLLYGPSVDQVFQDVSEDLVPEAADFLERELARLLDRGVFS